MRRLEQTGRLEIDAQALPIVYLYNTKLTMVQVYRLLWEMHAPPSAVPGWHRPNGAYRFENCKMVVVDEWTGRLVMLSRIVIIEGPRSKLCWVQTVANLTSQELRAYHGGRQQTSEGVQQPAHRSFEGGRCGECEGVSWCV